MRYLAFSSAQQISLQGQLLLAAGNGLHKLRIVQQPIVVIIRNQ